MLIFYILIALGLFLYTIRQSILDFALCHLPYTSIPGIPSLEQGEAYLTLYRTGLPRDQAMQRLEEKSPEGRELGLLQLPLISKSVLDVMDLEMVKQVFADHKSYPKAPVANMGDFLFGDALFIANGEIWQHHRRVMMSSFKQTRFSNLIMSTFQSLTRALTARIKSGEGDRMVMAPQDWIERAVFQVMGLFAYNHNYDTINNPKSRYFEEYENFLKILFTPTFLMHGLKLNPEYLKYVPIPGYYKMHQTRDFIQGHLQAIIDKRRKELADMEREELETQQDMLAHILIADNKDYSDSDIRSDLFSLFFAGHETTANSMGFCLYHLARYPVYQMLAREEAMNFMGLWNERIELKPEDMRKQMPNLYAILQETFRLYPAATGGINREAMAEDLKIGGFDIPIKSNVFPSIQTPQRSEKVWGPDAAEFRPERFFNDNCSSASGFNKEAMSNLIVFGYGPRSCLGKRIAVMEIMMGLATLLCNFQFTLPEDSPHYDRIQTKPAVGVLAADNLQLEIKLFKSLI